MWTRSLRTPHLPRSVRAASDECICSYLGYFKTHTGSSSALSQVFYFRMNSYRDEEVRDLILVLLPCFPIFRPTSLDIAPGSVDNHTGKENGVKPWKWAIKASDEAPSQCKVEITRIVDFPSIAVCSMSACAYLAMARLTYTIRPPVLNYRYQSRSSWDLRHPSMANAETHLCQLECLSLRVGIGSFGYLRYPKSSK